MNILFSRFYIIFITLLLFVLPSIGQNNPHEELVHIVVSIEGNAFIQRINWSASVTEPLALGAFVTTTDEIIPQGAAKVAILCANFVIDTIVEDARPPACVQERNDGDVFHIFGINSTRGRGVTDNVPYLIVPRASPIMNTRPAFLWAVIDGASSYEISLLRASAAGMFDEAWTQPYLAVEGRMDYPSAESDLQPGDYQVNISPIDAMGNPISIPGDADAGNVFTVVDISLATTLNRGVAAINAAEFPSFTSLEMPVYVTAIYMLHNDFRADALEGLNNALGINPQNLTNLTTSSALSQSPAPFMRLGEIYVSIGLSKEAIQAYENALLRAIDTHNRLFEAQAREALAELNTDLNIKWCQQDAASKLYTEIDERDAALQLQQLLDSQGRNMVSRPNCAEVLKN
jgi:tetratricopeptide (TPR) repeat protein